MLPQGAGSKKKPKKKRTITSPSNPAPSRRTGSSGSSRSGGNKDGGGKSSGTETKVTYDDGSSRPSSPRTTGGWRKVILGGRSLNLTNPFWRYNTRYQFNRHTGVDFGAASGTPLRAPIKGTVVGAGYGVGGSSYGNTVVIRMDDGYYMRFAHMNSIGVSKGQRVRAGQFVGKVGNSGTNSSGSHLHLEVMKPSSGGRYGRDSFVNPVEYLNGKKTQSTIRGGGTTGGGGTGGEGDAQTVDQGWTGAGGNTTINNTTTTGDFGGIEMAKFSKKDMYAMLEAKFGSIDTLLAMDKKARDELGGKSLRWAINKIVKEKQVNSDVMLTYLNKTGWFKKYSVEMTNKLVLQKQKPEQAKLQIRERKKSIEALLNQAGVQISDAALNTMARNAWVYDWSDQVIVDKVQDRDDVTYSGGEIAAGVDTLEAYANDYGVNLTDADINQFRQDYLDNRGDQEVRDTIQQRAAQTYAVFADQILGGQSTRSLAGAYFNRAAEMLETDPNSIDWDDPLFKGGKAFTATDANGKQAVRGLWDFEKEIRQDSRWMDTENARDEVYSTGTGVLKQMGLI